MLNEDVADKDRVFGVITEWLDSEEEAHSLLHHLATALAPGWSAVKYVLLLGEGRNGKSLLMKMLHQMIGWDNVSSVTRQNDRRAEPGGHRAEREAAQPRLRRAGGVPEGLGRGEDADRGRAVPDP